MTPIYQQSAIRLVVDPHAIPDEDWYCGVQDTLGRIEIDESEIETHVIISEIEWEEETYTWIGLD